MGEGQGALTLLGPNNSLILTPQIQLTRNVVSASKTVLKFIPLLPTT